MTRVISQSDVAAGLTWSGVVEALREGHRRPKPEIGDMLLGGGEAALLNRGAWIEGLGFGVKAATIMAGNAARGLPAVHSAMLVFDPDDGSVKAVIEGALVTGMKTAGDSVFGASLLARPDSRRLLIVGAGTVGESLVRAYSEIFPDLAEIRIWNRTAARAEALSAKLAEEGYPVTTAAELSEAVAAADIVASATMTSEPILRGEWVRPGTHIDLIGAFRPDMREADDALLRKGRLFVDSRETTIHHIGELTIPIAAGVIEESDVLADFYDLVAGAPGRQGPEDITVFKNGGGAHLDLMTASHIISVAGSR